MRFLFLFLLLTACTTPKTETKQKAAAKAFRPTPPWEVDTSLEAFTNYAKYFRQSPRYPFILLKDGKIDSNPGEWEGTNRHLAVKFKNTGKVLAYTNNIGGVIINDEEILVTADELEKIYDTNLPFFTEEEYPDWTAEVFYQNRLYRYIYDHGLSDLKKIKPLGEGKKYLKLEDVENKPNAYLTYPRALGYLAQLDLGSDLVDMFLYTIANKEEQRRAAWYFRRVPSPTYPGRFDSSGIRDPAEIRWGKKSKLAAEVLVFDSPEKTHIRMLNLLMLNAQAYHHYLILPDYIMKNRATMIFVDRTFRFY